jgi:iron complex outermembrane recepter protein
MTYSLSRGAWLVHAAFGLAAAGPAWAQADAPQGETQRVTITGSSIKRIDAETALPVQVITRDEIARSGVTSTEQLLSSVSAISAMGATTNAMGAGSSTGGLSSVSLRGLTADRTLVLVNGRRLAPFPGGANGSVNINTIPLGAIERVEVLKDGASGVYGSDAIAGVVNFILTKSFDAVELSVSAGTPTRDGGGKSKKAGIVAGFGDLDADRFSVVVSGSVEKEDLLFARDRSFARSGNVAPFFESGATGQGNIEGAWIPGLTLQEVEASAGPRFFRSPNSGYGNPVACDTLGMFQRAAGGFEGAPVCAFDSAPYVGLLPQRELASFTLNGTWRATESLDVFADVLWGRSKVTQSFQPNPLRASFLETDALFAERGVDPALLIYPDNPNYPTAYLQERGFTDLIGKPLSITSRETVLGNRVNQDTNTQLRATLGVSGRVAGQDIEVAISHNSSKLEGRAVGGYFSQVAYVAVINDPANNPLWNPWAPGGAQPAELADKLKATAYTGQTLNGQATTDLVDGKITGNAFTLPGGMAQYALGYQGRREKYKTEPSEALFSGDIAGLGGSVAPVDRSRTVHAVFGELSVPIVKRLEATVAVRGDKYNDVGSSTNYNGSLRWRATDTLMLRGSVGTGFRAPTLVDLWTPQTLGNSEQFDDPATGQTDLQVNALSGGNPALKPEKSQQVLVGLVFSPIRQFTATVDVFRIRLRDIINLPSVQEVVSGFRRGDPAYAGLVRLSPTNEIQQVSTILTNAGDAKLSGVDVELGWRDSYDFGRLDLNLVGTYMSRFDETSPSGFVSHKVGTMVDENGDPVLGAQNGGVVLRWKHTFSANLTHGAWSGTLVQNFYKGYRDGNDLEGRAHFVPSRATYDAQVAWRGWRGLKLALGVKNLLDSDPPVYIPVSNQFQTGYDVTLYDPRGRFVYVNASYRF